MPDLPPAPIFNLPKIFKLRDALQDNVFFNYFQCTMEGQDYATVLAYLQKELKAHGDPVDPLALGRSTRYLLGRVLTPKLSAELAWRIAGNVERLRSGQAALPWVRQTEREWVPVQITGNRYALQKIHESKHHRSGRTFRFRYLAGSPCGVSMTQFWSNPKIDVLSRLLGFGRKPPMHKVDQSELTSFRFLALVEPSRSERYPGFFHVHCPPSLLDFNKDLIRKRRRIRFECPNRFSHECHQCHLGVKSCGAAVHPFDYAVRPCTGCGREWWFDTDPGFVNDFCVSCQPLISVGLPIRKVAEQ